MAQTDKAIESHPLKRLTKRNKTDLALVKNLTSPTDDSTDQPKQKKSEYQEKLMRCMS